MPELFLENLRDAVKLSDKDSEVIIDSRKDGIYVGATNGSHSAVFSSALEGVEQFFAAIPQPTANQLARSLTPEKLSLRVVDGVFIAKSKGVNLKSPLSHTRLTLAKLMNKYAKDPICKVTNLKHGIELVKYAANDKTIGDVVLQGYHLVLKESHAEIMASNGAVMAVTTIPSEGMGKTPEVLLLNPNFNQLTPYLDGEVDLGIKDNTLSLTRALDNGRTIRMVSALTQGSAFNYDAVLKLSEDNKITMVVPTKDMQDALKSISYFTDDQNHNRVTMSIHTSKILMEAYNNNGEANTEVDTESALGMPDGGIQLTTNYNNLSGFINTTKSPSFGLKIKNGTSPIFLTDSEKDDEYYTLRAMSVVFS